MDLENIKRLCANKQIDYSHHIVLRMAQRGITDAEVEEAILNGEIIEVYLDDTPYPSCLLFGHTRGQRKLHIVCAVSDHELHLITTYVPDNITFHNDFKTRRKDD